MSVPVKHYLLFLIMNHIDMVVDTASQTKFQMPDPKVQSFDKLIHVLTGHCYRDCTVLVKTAQIFLYTASAQA